MFAIWWTGALAWTWYAFAGSATTSLVALGLAMLPAFRIAPADSVTVVK
jgi:hypothetical protein